MMESGNDTNGTLTWTWKAVSWQWWEVFQLIFSLVGMAGNLLVMLVLFRPRRQRCSTDTLIAGLAVADFLTSVFIIPHAQVLTLPDTVGAQFYCRMIHSSTFLWISICASIFTLTTISVERLVAVRYPFLFQRLFTVKRTALSIVFIWIASSILNTFVPLVVFYSGGTCTVSYSTRGVQMFIGILVFLIEYLFPVCVMVFAHVMTIRLLRERVTTSTATTATDTKLLKARQRVINMLFTVVITFIICWSPDQFFYLALNTGLIGPSYLYSPLYRLFVVLAFINSCANPIIYAARNPNFRKAIMELFGAAPILGMKAVFATIEDKVSKTQKSDTTKDTGTDASSSMV